MPTAAAPKGSSAEYLMKDQGAFGTAATGNYTRVRAYSDTLQFKQGWEDENLLGDTKNNALDSTAPQPALPDGSGNGIVVPLDLDQIGHWLKGAIGAPASTGSSPDYEHVFTPSAVLPHRTIEKKIAASLFYQYRDVIVKTLDFDLQRGPGYDRCSVGLLVTKETKLTSTGGGTPSAISTRDPLLKWLPVFKIGGTTVADVMSLRATLDNKAAPDESLGDAAGFPMGHDLDEPWTFTGSFRLRMRGATVDDLALARSALTGELLWSKSAARSLSIAMAALYLEPAGKPYSGAGKIEQTFNFRCAQTAAAPMLTATLKNAIASY